jgi:hypothetical protein
MPGVRENKGVLNARITAVVDPDTAHNVGYWAKKHGISTNQFLRDALEFYIRYQHKDFDIPDLLIQRVNQVVDGMSVLSSNVQTSIDVMTAGFDSITALARGENYLLEPDDGELP